MSDTGKLIIAFFLGLAVALGSAFYFMRPATPPAAAAVAAAPAVAPAPIVPPIGAPVATSLAPPATAPEQPAPERKTKKPALVAKAPRKEVKQSPAAAPAPQPSAPAETTPSVPAEIASAAPPPPPPAKQAVFTPTPTPPPAQPHTITLQSGTVLNVRLNDALTSEHNNSGDTFHATLTSPLVVDGFVIADRGSKVAGEVLSADRAGRVHGRASLTLALNEINTTDGQHIRVQTDSFNKEATGSKGKDAAKIAAGAGLGALIGGLAGGGKGAGIGAGAGGAAGTGVVLGTRGNKAELPSETALTFRLSSPVTVTEQMHN